MMIMGVQRRTRNQSDDGIFLTNRCPRLSLLDARQEVLVTNLVSTCLHSPNAPSN